MGADEDPAGPEHPHQLAEEHVEPLDVRDHPDADRRVEAGGLKGERRVEVRYRRPRVQLAGLGRRQIERGLGDVDAVDPARGA